MPLPACSVRVDEPGAIEAVAVRAQALTTGAASGSCERTREGLVSAPDACAGSGAGRVLVKLGPGASCGSLLGFAVGGIGGDAVRKRFLFDTAPSDVKEKYCVLEDARASAGLTSDVRAESIVRELCAIPEVEAAARDCSGAKLPRSSVDPNAYAPPEGEVVPPDASASLGAGASAPLGGAPAEVEEPPTSEVQTGKNSCDVCATEGAGALFVALPRSFVGKGRGGNALPIVLRISAANAPDMLVQPPAGAQSFSVDGVDVPAGARVTVYAPGITPPPKGQGE